MCRFKLNKIVCYFNIFGFNTSYVSVQVLSPLAFVLFLLSFNTSYVSVQVDTDLTTPSAIKFQYILCVGSRHLRSMEVL